MALSTKTLFWGDVVILRYAGRLVAGSETITFRQRVEKLLSAKRKFINLAQVNYADSTGVATLAYFFTLNSDSESKPQAGLFQNEFEGVAPPYKIRYGHHSVCERNGESPICRSRFQNLMASGMGFRCGSVPTAMSTSLCKDIRGKKERIFAQASKSGSSRVIASSAWRR